MTAMLSWSNSNGMRFEVEHEEEEKACLARVEMHRTLERQAFKDLCPLAQRSDLFGGKEGTKATANFKKAARRRRDCQQASRAIVLWGSVRGWAAEHNAPGDDS